MPKEVRVQLTASQKAKIKAATGNTMSEIRVSSMGKNLAVSTGNASLRGEALRAEALRADATRGDISAESLRGEALRGEALRGEALR
ncbi:MAG: hypothetical protein M3R62_13985, partial [Acidobacteriota bacterium]|nr:hypothetical protein [Acidobacteriota bacterium]